MSMSEEDVKRLREVMNNPEMNASPGEVQRVATGILIIGFLISLPALAVFTLMIYRAVTTGKLPEVSEDFWPPNNTTVIFLTIAFLIGIGMFRTFRKLRSGDSSTPLFANWFYGIIILTGVFCFPLTYFSPVAIVPAIGSCAFFVWLGVKGIRYNNKKYPKR